MSKKVESLKKEIESKNNNSGKKMNLVNLG